MLSEEKKQKILDGAYCVTRNGKKAKLVYTSIYPVERSYLFIIIDTDLKIDYPVSLNSNFRFYNRYESPNDIVNLWTDYLDVSNH